MVQLTVYSVGVEMYIVCTICSGPSAFVDSKGGSSVGPQDGGLYYLHNVEASVHRQFTFVEMLNGGTLAELRSEYILFLCR